MMQFVVFRSQLGVAGGTLELHVQTTDALVAMGTAQELTPDGGIYQAEFDSVAVDDYVLKHINAAGKTQWIDTVRVSSASGTFLSFDVTGASGGSSFPSEAPANWLKSAGIQDGALTADKFAASSLNGKGDWATEAQVQSTLNDVLGDKNYEGRFDIVDQAIVALSAQITALNNLSAKANWFGSLLLEVPDAGTRAYLFELVIKDDEDKLTNLTALPTIALTNAAGTDRSSLITTGIALAATGRYTLTITVATGTANEALRLTATGNIAGESRYAVIMPQVVDYDSATQINTILTRIGTPSISLTADIATRLATSAYTAPDNAGIGAAKTAAESTDAKLSSPRLAKIDGAAQTGADNDTLKSLSDQLDGVNFTTSTIATGIANVLLKFTGMTSLADWIRRFVRKDAGTAEMATAQAEINTGGASTFDGLAHSLEKISEGNGSGFGPVASSIVDGFSTDGRAQLVSALAAAQDDGTPDPAAPCIPVVSGSDWRIDFTAIGDLSNRTNLIFAMKLKASDADAASLVLIDRDGLKVSNGQVPATASNGAIVVTDEVAGTGYVLVKAAATNVPAGPKRVGLKVIKTTGEVRTAELWRPCVTVLDGIVDATS